VYHRQDSRHSNFTRVEDLLLDSHSDCPERLGPAGTSKLLEAVIVNRILSPWHCISKKRFDRIRNLSLTRSLI